MLRVTIDDVTRRHISLIHQALCDERRRIDADGKSMLSNDKLNSRQTGLNRPNTGNLLYISRLPRPRLPPPQATNRRAPRLQQSSKISQPDQIKTIRPDMHQDLTCCTLPPIATNNLLRVHNRYDYPPDREHMHFIVFDRPFQGELIIEHPRPLPRKLDSLRIFRISAMVVLFTIIIKKKDTIKELMGTFQQDRISDWHFALRIKEFVLLMQKIYLDPKKKIYMTLSDLHTNDTIDFYSAISTGSTRSQRNLAISNLNTIVKNIIYDITSIKPEDGALLAINRKSFVYECTKSGRRFPQACLWQIERDLLQFDDDNRTVNVESHEGFLLLIIFFLGKSFIRAIVLEPVRSRLMESAPAHGRVENNFKILATVLVRLLRQVLCPRNNTGTTLLPEVRDVSRQLFSDEIMNVVYVKLHQSFDYAEKLLRNWGMKYIDQLHAL